MIVENAIHVFSEIQATLKHVFLTATQFGCYKRFR